MSPTHGLLLHVVEGFRASVDGLAVNLVRPSSVVFQAADDVLDVRCCHHDGLAIVQRLNGGERLHVGLDEVGKLDEHARPGLGGDLLPGALECLSGGGNGNVDILLGGFCDRADWFLYARLILPCAVDRLCVPSD